MQLLITAFYSYEKTWSIDPLIQKELVNGPRSSKKSWLKNPLTKKELVIGPRSSKKELVQELAHLKRAG